MQNLPNDGLYITRKRKKWKFAHFDSYQNCFSLSRNEDPKTLRKQLDNYFQVQYLESRPVVLELAAGTAELSLELAKRYPEKNFVAIDIKSDRLYTSAKKALAEKINNIAFIRMHINELGQLFGKNSVDEVWLTFPDPYPKKRSAKHRLTHQTFLQLYRNILKDTGTLKFKTDNRDLFLWSLEQFMAEKWEFDELSFDLHESNFPDEYKIKTAYERKFTAKDIPINFVALTKK